MWVIEKNQKTDTPKLEFLNFGGVWKMREILGVSEVIQKK
jgi:hypothetical protein